MEEKTSGRHWQANENSSLVTHHTGNYTPHTGKYTPHTGKYTSQAGKYTPHTDTLYKQSYR